MHPISHLLDFLRPRPDVEVEPAPETARKQETVEKLARAIASRRLEAPAALFLELNRPLGFLASQAVLFARPFLSVFLPPAEIDAAAEVIGDPESFDRLLDRIAELSRKDPC